MNRDRVSFEKSLQLALPVVLALSMSACSSSNDNQPVEDAPYVDVDNDDLPGLIIEGLNGRDPSQVFSPWFAYVELFRIESLTPGTGDAYLQLNQYDTDAPFSAHIEFYERDLDSCRIQENNSSTEPPTRNPSQSGGESVVLNTSSGPWFTMPRSMDEIGNVFYETDDGLPGALPADLTLSIPGDVFPSVPAYSLSEPAAPVRLSPLSGVAITSASEYRWVAGDSTGSMTIDFLEYDENGNFLGFAALCRLVDDGEFEMPTEITEFVQANTNTIEVRYSRELRRLDFQDGIAYFQSVEVAD